MSATLADALELFCRGLRSQKLLPITSNAVNNYCYEGFHVICQYDKRLVVVMLGRLRQRITEQMCQLIAAVLANVYNMFS